MSRESIQAIEEAIKAHIKEVEEDDLILADFLVIYSGSHLVEMKPEDGGGLEPCYHTNYTTNEGSNPITTIGLAKWMDVAIQDIVGDDEEEE